jgi:hypothetical protein
MVETVKKVTVLDGYCASGDCECFCFDKRSWEEQAQERSLPTEQRVERHDECRVYPNDILPDTGKKRGRWVITVEFTPETAVPKR